MKYNRIFRTFVLIPVVLFVITASQSALHAQDKVQQIDELVSQYYDYGQFNGTILVAEKGNVIYKKGFGSANMEWNIPNQPDTKFRIGSITKQFASMLIMQLVEQGKVKLDGKLIDYIPEYRADSGSKITIHHLLTHTSGIPPYTGLPGFWADSSRNPYDIDYSIKHFHSGDLEFEPGTKYKYNNSGYFLLGVIVERVTGKSFEENLQERILKPLKMANSGTEQNEVIVPKMASGYMKRLNEYVNESYFYMPNALGAGNMFSTVEDLFFWDQALYGEKLLSRKYKEKMFTPFLNNYGYGWGIRNIAISETDSLKTISHGGGINGFNTIIFRLVEDRHSIIIFNNTGGAPLRDMSIGISKILYGKSYDLPKKSLAETLLATILEENVVQAIEQYHDLQENNNSEYDFSEQQLNRLGYQLLRQDRVEDAIEIFKLNVEMFPDASNPYDSLGEAYMVHGNKELAIKNYARSLELNPQNTNAIHQLKRIIDNK